MEFLSAYGSFLYREVVTPATFLNWLERWATLLYPSALAIWVRFSSLYVRSSLTRSMRCKMMYFSRSEEHTSELQSLMRISYAVFCLKKKHTIVIKLHH